MAGIVPIIVLAGPVQALSLTASAHTAVALTAWPGRTPNYVWLQNSGAIPVAIAVTPNGIAPGAFPVDPTPNDGVVVLLAGQSLAVPYPRNATGGASITGIGSAAGPSIVYATPVAYQA